MNDWYDREIDEEPPEGYDDTDRCEYCGRYLNLSGGCEYPGCYAYDPEDYVEEYYE